MIRRIASRGSSSHSSIIPSIRSFVQLSYPPQPRLSPISSNHLPKVPTAVFIDNNGLPPNYDPRAVVKVLRTISLNDGGSLRQFTYFLNDDDTFDARALRAMGVAIMSYSPNKRDRQCALLLTSMMWAFVADNEAFSKELRIICLTSDVDVMYAGSLLVNRGVKLTIIAPSRAFKDTSRSGSEVPSSLATATNYYFREDLPLSLSSMNAFNPRSASTLSPALSTTAQSRLDPFPTSPSPSPAVTSSPQDRLTRSTTILTAPPPSHTYSKSSPLRPDRASPPASYPSNSSQSGLPSSLASSESSPINPYAALQIHTAAPFHQQQQPLFLPSRPRRRLSNLPARPILFHAKGEPFEPIKKIVRVLPIFYPVSSATRTGLTYLFTNFLLEDIKNIATTPIESIPDSELVTAYIDFVEAKMTSWSSTKYQRLAAPKGTSRLSRLTSAAPASILAEARATNGNKTPKLEALLNVLVALVKLSGGKRVAFEVEELEKVVENEPEEVLKGGFEEVMELAEQKEWLWVIGRDGEGEGSKMVVARKVLTGFETGSKADFIAVMEKLSKPMAASEDDADSDEMTSVDETHLGPLNCSPYIATEREEDDSSTMSEDEVPEGLPPPATPSFKIVDGQMLWD